MDRKPTVFVVDDDELARESVGALAQSMGLDAETFSSAEAFLEQFDRSVPGCLVTDVRMNNMTGVELQRALLKAGASIPVIVITAYANTTMTVRAMKEGAVTLLEKPCRDEELCDAIQQAVQRDIRHRNRALERQAILGRLATLTPKENLVMKLIVAGCPNKVIATRLDVSIRTVEARRHNIFKKMDVASVAELVQHVLKAEESS